MPYFVRPVPFTVLCLTLAALGCGSGLKGKIEGKWKIVSVEGEDSKKNMPPGMDIYPVLDFQPDGVLAISIGSSDPKAAEGFNVLFGKMPSFKYKILSGDEIEVDVTSKETEQSTKGNPVGLNNGKAKVTITGDEMTIAPEKGRTMKLTRIK
jgi:hypothetical protein